MRGESGGISKEGREENEEGGQGGGVHANLPPAPITSVSGAWQLGRWV